MPVPVLSNMVGDPYSNADAARYLEMLASNAFGNAAHRPKFTSTFGQKAVEEGGHQKRLAQVLRQKLELSNGIKRSYDEHKRAGGTRDALFELGRYVAFHTGAIFVPGPLKGVDGVIRKVMAFTDRSAKEGAGYEGNYAMMKDEVRITLVCDDMKAYVEACNKMKEVVCGGGSGMSFMKNNTRDPAQDPCGYSDTNMVVRLPNGEPGEVQINNRAVMYGKMSDKSFKEQLKVDDDQYLKLAMNYEIDGGLGHAFYEIYRVAPQGVNGKRAAELSTRYYNLLRLHPHTPRSERSALRHDINEFRTVPEVDNLFMEAGVLPQTRARR